MTLLDTFEAQAKRTPTATAVTVEDGKSYSYKELDLIALHLGTELACAIAVAAVEEGQNETPLVAIMMTRGIALVAGILAPFDHPHSVGLGMELGGHARGNEASA